MEKQSYEDALGHNQDTQTNIQEKLSDEEKANSDGERHIDQIDSCELMV
jgi:hypothetical protein